MKTTPLLMLGLGLSFAMAAGCVKKGSGEGKRATRPFFEDQGSIKDDGKGNQKPKPDDPKIQKPDPDKPTKPDKPDKPDTPKMDPEAVKILAACMKIPEAEVQAVEGWDDKTKAVAAATALCANLDKVKYGEGVNPTAEAVAVE